MRNHLKMKSLLSRSFARLVAVIACFLLSGNLMATMNSTALIPLGNSLNPAMSYVLQSGYASGYFLAHGPLQIGTTTVGQLCATNFTPSLEVIPNNQDWFSSKNNRPNAFHVSSPFVATSGNNYQLWVSYADVDMGNAADSGWLGLGWTLYCLHP